MHNPYEPPAAAVPPTDRRPRPAPLRHVTVAMVIFAPAFLVVGDVPFDSLGFWMAAAITALSYFVLWRFWNGANWARWLVIASSVIGIFNLLALGTMNRASGVVVVLEAVLSAYLLVWLNRAEAKAYFIPSKPSDR